MAWASGVSTLRTKPISDRVIESITWRLKANMSKLLKEQPIDPATPEELSKFARCCTINLERDNAIRFEQSRRDCLDEVQSLSIWALADLTFFQPATGTNGPDQ